MARWITMALVLALPLSAHAQRGRASPEVARAIEGLGSADRAEVRAAIESLGLSGDPRGVAPIVERVRRGLPPDVLDAALDALTVLGRPEAGPLLIELLSSHRRPGVRLKAAAAIVACRPRGGDRALADALADSDPLVRGAAAEGLGTVGTPATIDALFGALDRRVDGAAVAIGRLARPEDVTRLLGYVGQLPFDQLTPALNEMLTRTTLAERARLSIVHRLSELATPEVRLFLEQLVAALPANDRDQVRRAAEDAIGRIGQ